MRDHDMRELSKPVFPRGTIIGKQTGGKPLTEATRYRRCPDCAGWIDILDPRSVLDLASKLTDLANKPEDSVTFPIVNAAFCPFLPTQERSMRVT
jgi:hypothetical protein